jgi:glucokinase-like ROK family protein
VAGRLDIGPGETGSTPRLGRRKVRAERDSLALVLSLVRSGRAETRQEIERLSGLSRAVVVDRVATLISSGLVEEGDLGASTGGRAPRQVRFASTAGHVLVGALGTTTLGVGLADLSGRLLLEHHEPADVTIGAARTLDRLEALFDWLLDEHPAARPVWGIGLALPGPVELAGGSLSSRAVLHLMPGWDDYPVRERLSSRFGAPVWLDSEVHLMALGELRAGRGAGGDDLLFLKIGTGISAGLCANGKLHRGAQGHAGDIGHIAVDGDNGVICRCGNTGCLEALAGGEAIAREGQLAAEDGRSHLLAEVVASGRAVAAADVGMAANRGDPFSIELLARSGRLVGETLATLVNAYNPSLVVVGGGVAQAGEILLAAMREALYRRSRSLATRDLHIVRSEMGKTAGLMGAAFAVADELFSWEYLRTWIDDGAPTRNPGAIGESPMAELRVAGQLGQPPQSDDALVPTAALGASRQTT